VLPLLKEGRRMPGKITQLGVTSVTRYFGLFVYYFPSIKV
jgi:hypothetical protein